MGIFTSLSNLFAGRNFSKLDETQEKALVDALTYAMAVDRDVDPNEQKELTKALKQLEWRASVPLETYVAEAVERAKNQTNDQAQAAQYCSDIGQRLAEDWLREETYYLAGRIAASDTEIVSEEQVLLGTMVQAFGIDNRTQARIADQLLRETDF